MPFPAGRCRAYRARRTGGGSPPAAKSTPPTRGRQAAPAAQLPVPVAQRHLLALEGGDREIRRLDEVLDRLLVGGLRAGGRLAMIRTAVHACMSLSRMRRLEAFSKPVSGSAPRPSPRTRDARTTASSRPSRPRPRQPRAVRQVGAEHLALVGGDQHVVVGRVLVNTGICFCTWAWPEVGLARAAVSANSFSVDDVRAEALGSALDRRRHQLVVGVRALDQKPLPPLLPHEILGKAVASIERVGAVWMTLLRQFSSRSESSSAPALKTSTSLPFTWSATFRRSAAGCRPR